MTAPDRGSIGVVSTAVVAIGLLIAGGVARLGGHLADEVRAQSAADALALASTTGSLSLGDLARANGVTIRTWTRTDSWSEVVVERLGMTARARVSNALP